MKYYEKIRVILLVIINLVVAKQLLSLYRINPYHILIGTAAIYKYDIGVTLNPATVGISEYPYLIQSIPITSSSARIFYSQEINLPIDKYNHLSIGFSLIDKNINIKNTLMRVKYSLRLFEFLYTGIQYDFRKENKSKASFGIFIPIRLGDFIKYLNFSIFGINSKLDKISLKLPNKNYGEYVAFGIATSLSLSRNTDFILSYDKDVIRDNYILSSKTGIHKAGIQLKFNTKVLNFRLMVSKEILNKKSYADNFGIELQKSFLILTIGNRYTYLTKREERYISVTFIGDRRKNSDINMDKEDIKVDIDNKNNKKVIFNFFGKRGNISYYKLVIKDDAGKIVKIFSKDFMLPSRLIWNMDKKVKKGLYTVKLIYIKNGVDYRIFKKKLDFAIIE